MKKITFSAFYFSLCALLSMSILCPACKNENQAAKQVPAVENPPPAPIVAVTNNDLKIDFPKFGSFDISSWEKVPFTNKEAEGDVTTVSVIYKKDDMIMQIDTLSCEYYDEVKHILKNSRGVVQKERSLHYSNDPIELIETVADFTVKPAKEYTRTESFKKHWSEMDKKPATPTGSWKEGTPEKR
jgi:hypothetical protein